jgi:Ni/Co efflux regulator RcnB
MKRILSVLAVSALCAVPALAQQADNCNPSGYATGVYSPQEDRHLPCDPNMVPRVNGVPQYEAAPTARPGYHETQPSPFWGGYDPERAHAIGQAQADRDRYYAGARGPEWRRGHRIPRQYMERQYWVQDWRAHRLPPPPRGHQWVQVGSDYVLVAVATGIMADILLAR